MYYNNNNYYGQPIGGNNFGSFRPQYPINKIPMNNNVLLSVEEINRLQKNNTDFNLNISDIEFLKSACVHRDQSGNLTIEATDDERVRCKICGKSFKMTSLSDTEIVNKIIDDFISLGETIKLSYVDIPVELREYFKFLPFAEKFRKLSEIALKSYENYAKQNNIQNYASNQSLAYRYQNIYNQPYFRGNMSGGPYQTNNFMANSYNNQPYEIFIGADNVQYARYADGVIIPINNNIPQQQPYNNNQSYSVVTEADGTYAVYPNGSKVLLQPNNNVPPNNFQVTQPQQPYNNVQHNTDVNGRNFRTDPVTGKEI